MLPVFKRKTHIEKWRPFFHRFVVLKSMVNSPFLSHNFKLVTDSTSLSLFVLYHLKLHSKRAIMGWGKHAPFGKCIFNFQFSQRK